MNVSAIKAIERRRWVMNNATKIELLKLFEYPNGTVKVIAYEGLLRKKGFVPRATLMLIQLKVQYIQSTIGLVVLVLENKLESILFRMS